MTKEHIRDVMLVKRSSIDAKTHQMLSLNAVERIKKHPLYIQAKTVGLYHPIKGELDLTRLIEEDKQFAIPRVDRDNIVYDVFDKETALKKSCLNIYESEDEISLHHPLDLIIVPALAVDLNNHRVGYGKGYFDRFIKNHPHIKTLCVVLDFQVIDYIDTYASDQRVCDIIVIEIEV
jgi:5-formyltetrahydrofolate cyclo-ligase